MIKEFEFQLSEKLEYSVKGDFEESATIVVKKPGQDVLDESTEFDQMIMRAMMSIGAGQNKDDDKEDDGKKENPNPDQMRVILFSAKDIKVRDVSKLFRKLVTKTGYIAENIKLKDSHLAKLSLEDFIDFMCGYASFFSAPLLLRGELQNKPGSA